MRENHSISLLIAKTEEDLDLIRPLSFRLHGESRYAGIEFDEERRDEIWRQAIANQKSKFILIALYKGEAIGYLYAMVGDYLVGKNHLIASMNAFYVVPEYRQTAIGGRVSLKMLTALKKWSENRSVKEILFHVTSGIDVAKSDRFFRKLGFQTVGGNYAFQLQAGE